MRFISRISHYIISALRLDRFFIFLTPLHPFFKKLIPPHTYFPFTSMRRVTRNGAKFNLDISDYMQWYLYVKGVDIAWKVAMERLVQGSLILDVGANVGQFGLCLAQALYSKGIANIDIYAFEPNPQIFKLLKGNISLNGNWSNKLIPFQLALGANNSTAFFESGGRNSGAGRLTKKKGKSEVEVEVVTMASFLSKYDIPKRVSFIKIDVEGFEPEVITGGWSLICEQRPVLYFEFTPSWCRERGVHAVETLLKLDSIQYEMFYEENGHMLPVAKKYGLIEKIYQTNILAIPKVK